MARPLIFKTPEELESKINEYFKLCDTGEEVEELTKRGELVKYRKQIPYTLEGLADHLDCESKTLRNYSKKDGFDDVLSRAKNKVYRQWVERGLTDSYNSKVVCLCMAANMPDYRLNNESKIQLNVSIEDALRQIEERRQSGMIQSQPARQGIDMD